MKEFAEFDREALLHKVVVPQITRTWQTASSKVRQLLQVLLHVLLG